MTNQTSATSASRYLVALAGHNAEVYINLPMTRAIIVAGSAAQGVADSYSDLDMMVYYDEMPDADQLSAAVLHNGGVNHRVLAKRTDSEFMEQFTLHGVECQIAHCIVAAWEREMASVLEQFDVTSPTQKALSGVLEAIPLYGEPLVQVWQAHIATYPDGLATAMVNHYLKFFPLWGLGDSLTTRDATVWAHKMLAEAAENMLGVLAGINRVYYSPFQLKRMHRLLGKMHISPTHCGDRIDALFVGDLTKAIAVLEPLVSEVIDLVEKYMPQIDTARAKQRLGWRHLAWDPFA